MINSSQHKIYTRLWRQLSTVQKKLIGSVIFLTSLTSIIELIALVAIVPLLIALSNPQEIASYKIIKYLKLSQIFEKSTNGEIVLIVALIFIMVNLLSGILRVMLLWGQIKLSQIIGIEISSRIFDNILSQPYEFHIKNRTASTISLMSTKTSDLITETLTPTLILISSSVMLLIILVGLLMVSHVVALTTFVALFIIYFIITMLSRIWIRNKAKDIAKAQNLVVKNIQEGVGNIRDIIIDDSKELYLNRYAKNNANLKKSQASVNFISNSPRYVIESLGMTVLAFSAIIMTSDGHRFYDALPVLALTIMSIQKMLPIAQQIYYCWTHINANTASAIEIIEHLEIKKPNKKITSEVLRIRQSFQMENVSFTYGPSTSRVLRNISFKFSAGDRIGIRGPSGGGKSTLVDLILGLLKPSSGLISVDGILLDDENIQIWRNSLAHVPQQIYLSDVTIAENIALGINLEKINMEKVEAAARAAEIHDDIVKMQKGYLTSVGERGINLSGGQRQRIGIARAIYKNANVIILDEATSALDNETEIKVIRGIEKLEPHISIVMVAHRLSTLKNCHRVYELNDGKLTEVSI